MGYYARGDFYRGRGDFYRGRGDAGSALATISQALPDWMPGVGTLRTIAAGGASALGQAMARSPSIVERALGPARVQGTRARTIRITDPNAPFGGRMYRRINPLNPKALRRALRRAKGFERFARRVMHFTHRRPGQTRFKFPKRKRRT
jgi:hypothetical protein